MLEDKGQGNGKAKYQLIYHMEERLNEILESHNCSLKNIRLSHESSHKGNTQDDQDGLSRIKSCKKVMFQALPGEKRTSIKKDVSLQASCLKSRKSIVPSNLKTFKSLNCSFTALGKAQSFKSNRSVRTINTDLPETRKHASQILRKFAIFLSTQITQKQIIEWLQAYCEKESSILLRLFVKVRKLSCHKGRKVSQIFSLELDEDAIHARLEMRLRDGTGGQRFVTALEMSDLSVYLEKSFVEKLKIKTKQFQESIGSKLKTICQKIRREDDNEYILNIRKKPVEISDFLVDVSHFENSFGPLKKINSLNRAKFKMLNDTDLIINRYAKDINGTRYTAKNPSITLAR